MALRALLIAALLFLLVIDLPSQVEASIGASAPTVLDSGDAFGEQGWAVDVSGNVAIVGAPFYQGGNAFLYDVTTGELLHRLRASDSSADSLFGYSVAIDGDLAVVASGQRNAAYVFDVQTGRELHRLTPTGDRNDFIRSVDISDGIAVLGAPTVEFGGIAASDYGAAFVYDARTGSLMNRINGPTSFAKRNFGAFVSVDGGDVAVASLSSFSRNDVIVYDAVSGAERWTYGYTTTGQDFTAKDVVIKDGVVAVGVGTGSLFGMPKAIVLDQQDGSVLNELDILRPNENERYRTQIDVSGDRLVVGSWGTFYEDVGYYVGDVYSFDISTGEFLGGLPNPFPVAGDSFGFGVAMDGNRLVVGAPDVGDNRGLAYAYILVPEPCACLLVTLGGLTLYVWRHGDRSRRM